MSYIVHIGICQLVYSNADRQATRSVESCEHLNSNRCDVIMYLMTGVPEGLGMLDFSTPLLNDVGCLFYEVRLNMCEMTLRTYDERTD